MTKDVRHGNFETFFVAHLGTVVVAERLFVEVAKEMERFHTNVGSANTTLEKRPEVLKAVGVNAAVDILDSMIHNLVSILTGKSFIGQKGICVEGCTSFDMPFDFSLKSGLLAVRNNARANLAAALKDTHDSGLILGAGACDPAGTLREMHIASFAANKCFVGLYFTSKLTDRRVMHSSPNAVKHVPCRLLRDADRTSKLTGANAVLAIRKKPVCTHPFVESKRAILKDRSDLKAELLLAAIALPEATRFDKGMTFGAAARARNYAIRKAKIKGALKCAVLVAKVNDRFLESARRFHELNVRQFIACVKYVIAQ